MSCTSRMIIRLIAISGHVYFFLCLFGSNKALTDLTNYNNISTLTLNIMLHHLWAIYSNKYAIKLNYNAVT